MGTLRALDELVNSWNWKPLLLLLRLLLPLTLMLTRLRSLRSRRGEKRGRKDELGCSSQRLGHALDLLGQNCSPSLDCPFRPTELPRVPCRLPDLSIANV
jgi:hypothetical protein